MVLTTERFGAILQELADADWGILDITQVCARIHSSPGVRLVGPIAFPATQPSIVRIDVQWADTGTPWPSAALLTGDHTLQGVVEVAAIMPSTPEGCSVDLRVSRPIACGKVRLYVLAADIAVAE